TSCLFSPCLSALLALHSFPTRRSSDLPPMRAAPLRPADRILAEPPNDLPLLRREAPPNDLLLLRRELLRREAPPNDLPPLLREDPPPRERPPLEPPDLLLMRTSLVVCP